MLHHLACERLGEVLNLNGQVALVACQDQEWFPAALRVTVKQECLTRPM